MNGTRNDKRNKRGGDYKMQSQEIKSKKRKKSLNEKRNNDGITLIALVITINCFTNFSTE